MTTLLPTSQSTGVEAYEDMFKEITRKLYGDESAHGLYPHNTQVAQLAPGAPTAPPEGGERSFTTLVSDRNLTQIGYETTTVGAANQPPLAAGTQPPQQQHQQQQQPEHITSTAFGLAALMQNGFPPPGTILNPVNFPGASKTPTNISIPSSDDRWASQPGSEVAWNGVKHPSPSTSAGYGGKSYKKPKKERPDASSPSGHLNIPSTADRSGKGGSYPSTATSPSGPNVIKRYSCASCPYTTDRRDLFTRHENIHKDEKPFQCYACLKPFNRADHVKKHFLRMHRELEYDIAKTRRHPPGAASGSKGSSYYGNGSHASTLAASSSNAAMSLAQMHLNIPSGSFAAANAASSHAGESTGGAHNGGHSGQLLQLQSHHHQQQQQQQHQQHHNAHQVSHLASLSIKQEKSSGSLSASNRSLNTSGSSLDEKPFAKKIKGEKKFACTYCPWAGADNWGLKRHLNTHTKPYVCLLCDYKAARSERLATHVLKVHNKKACGKCSFFAEDQAHLDSHLQEAHPHDVTKSAGRGPGTAVGAVGAVSGRGSTSGSSSGSNGDHHCGPSAAHHSTGGTAGSNGNVLRNLGNAFTSNSLPTNIPTSGNGFGHGSPDGHYHSANVHHHPATGHVLTNSNAANLIDTINQHVLAAAAQGVGQNGRDAGTGNGTGSLQQHQPQQHQQPQWVATRPHRKRGSELLYSYLEADGSDSGDYARLLHMQAVGRNKASVTQDFHNAGGGDNNGGMNGAGAGYGGHAAAPYSYGMASIERGKRKHSASSPGSDGSGPGAHGKGSDSVNLSLASLFGGDQLSFLQLLATAAVAHQQLQLHSGQQAYHPSTHQQQQKKQPKPSKAADHPVGASNGVRYGSMVSSPPATSTQQPQSRTASTTSTGPTGGQPNSTNGSGGAKHPAGAAGYQLMAQPLALDSGSHKKRRVNASSSDKENYLHRNQLAPPGQQQQQQQPPQHQPQQQHQQQPCHGNGTGAVNGGSADKHLPYVGSKIGHTYNHHHNNNNSSTSNKNINDIFDKVYKKPQNSFGASKPTVIQQHPPPAAHTLASILRTAPPSAVEEDNRRSVSRPEDPHQAEQFSLVEFLKNHTEVSISTVGVPGSDCPSGSELDSDDLGSESTKRSKSDGERNPRKQYQPRRREDVEPDSEHHPDLPMALVKVELRPGDQASPAKDPPGPAKVPAPGRKPTDRGSRLADIRDKHMIKLITNRRCCRICQNKGLLDHLDNCHYHSKISLILHTRWRHRGAPGTAVPKMQCHQCGSVFCQRYKLVLHQRLTKHTGVLVKRQAKKLMKRSPSNGKKGPPAFKVKDANGETNGSDAAHAQQHGARNEKRKRKQRKRKPRSRCFTTRRKK